MRRLVFLLGTLLFSGAVCGQLEIVHSFTHYTRESGLVSNEVNSSIQDATGFMWIATNDGLSRFDGTRYLSFRHEESDPHSIPLNQVLQLLMDKNNNMWLLTNNGKAGIFDVKNFTFHEAAVKPLNDFSMKAANKKLIIDEFGHLMLLLGGNELLTFNPFLNEFSPKYNFIFPNSGWKINDIVQQRGTHRYWLSVQNIGLASYNQSTKQFSYHGNNAEQLAPIEEFNGLPPINYFLFDKKDRLWFSSFDSKSAYLHCYDFRNRRTLFKKFGFVSTYKGYYDITGFMEQGDSTIWFRGFRTLGRYLEKEKQFDLILSGSTHENGIDYRYISSLYEDREKNIWIGTGANGVFRLNLSEEYFRNIGHLNRQTGAEGSGNPMAFFRDKDGSILVGAWTDGLFRYDSSFKTIPLGIKGFSENNNVNVYDMCPSGDSNTVWLASEPGIYSYDQKNRSVKYFTSPQLGDQAVREVAEDRYGNLWMGLYRTGVFKWDRRKGEKNFSDGISRFTAIPDVRVRHIFADSTGDLWIATLGAGLYVIDPRTDSVKMHFDSKAPPSQNIREENVTATLRYNDSLMAIASANYLFFYNLRSHRLLQLHKNNRFAGEIASMEKDEKGRLWLGTTAGLYRIVIGNNVMVMFDRNNGIVNDYFIMSASYHLPDNTMMFGTSGNIIVFNADAVNPNIKYPEVTLTGFHLVNRSLPVDSLLHLKQVELGPNDNSLTIDFSTLTYSDNYVVLYQLEGLDKKTRAADISNQLIYSYIPAGTYRLKFKTVNFEGKTREDAFSIVIKVAPYFWQTWWFLSICFLVAACFVYWLDRQRTQRIVKEHQMRVSIAGNLHEDINTTLRNINVLSEIAAMKSGSQPEQAREYLKDIQHKSRSMVVAMNDMLWSIAPENDNMNSTTERLHEIASEIRGSDDVDIQVQSSGGVSKIRLNMKSRLELISIYKLMLELLVQRAGARETLVQFDCENRTLALKVFSPNVRLKENDGTVEKIVEEIRSRAGELNAILTMHTDQHGTDFLLQLKT